MDAEFNHNSSADAFLTFESYSVPIVQVKHNEYQDAACRPWINVAILEPVQILCGFSTSIPHFSLQLCIIKITTFSALWSCSTDVFPLINHLLVWDDNVLTISLVAVLFSSESFHHSLIQCCVYNLLFVNAGLRMRDRFCF